MILLDFRGTRTLEHSPTAYWTIHPKKTITMRFCILFLLFNFFLAGIPTNILAQKAAHKKRVAVFLFDDKSDSNFGWYGSKSVGEGVSDMIVTELVQSGLYRVIEREQLNALLHEQDLGASGIVTPESAAKVGQLLGVEIAVMGAVSEFGYKRDETGVRVRGTRVGVGKQSAVAGIDLRLVNTSTGEILLAENVRETKNALSGSLDVKQVSFKNQKDFDQSLVGKVTREAVENVVQLINNHSDRVPWQAKVVTSQGGNVYINSGSLDGVEVGEVFKVYRKGQALVDPDTGLELGSIDQEIGAIRVTDNSVGDGKAAACSIVSGSGFEKGDVVKEE